MAERRLPGAPESEDRVVCHVDMDCFYAACERLREPELRGEPVVVGMGYAAGQNHGAVATASYEAREYGVASAQGIETAIERLPPMERAESDPELDPSEAGYYRPVDMEYYESVSEEVRTILREVADTLRVVSIDEAYLDVTESTDWAHVEGLARHLKERIDREVGVTASVGVADSMSTAKLASDYDKPDGLVIVPPEETESFLAPQPIENLHGVGPVTAGELRDAGVETIGELAATEHSWVSDRFGERGVELWYRARGEDDREVTPMDAPKSLSRESAFAEAVVDPERKHSKVSALAESVADRARRKGALYRTIGIKVVEPPFDVNTRAESLPGPVDDPELLEDIALDLLTEFEDREVRKLGVRVSNLEFAENAQPDLGDWDGEVGDGGANLRPQRQPEPRGQATLTDFDSE